MVTKSRKHDPQTETIDHTNRQNYISLAQTWNFRGAHLQRIYAAAHERLNDNKERHVCTPLEGRESNEEGRGRRSPCGNSGKFLCIHAIATALGLMFHFFSSTTTKGCLWASSWDLWSFLPCGTILFRCLCRLVLVFRRKCRKTLILNDTFTNSDGNHSSSSYNKRHKKQD